MQRLKKDASVQMGHTSMLLARLARAFVFVGFAIAGSTSAGTLGGIVVGIHEHSLDPTRAGGLCKHRPIYLAHNRNPKSIGRQSP